MTYSPSSCSSTHSFSIISACGCCRRLALTASSSRPLSSSRELRILLLVSSWYRGCFPSLILLTSCRHTQEFSCVSSPVSVSPCHHTHLVEVLLDVVTELLHLVSILLQLVDQRAQLSGRSAGEERSSFFSTVCTSMTVCQSTRGPDHVPEARVLMRAGAMHYDIDVPHQVKT